MGIWHTDNRERVLCSDRIPPELLAVEGGLVPREVLTEILEQRDAFGMVGKKETVEN